jgi:site-specific DNA-methyltransferase (adenine-specific)
MKSKLIAALDATCQGFSPDRVVADPELNAAFLSEAGRLGLTAAAATLNRSLLNLRKAGDLRGRKSKKTSFADEGDYRFAAEMAIRFLERRDGISLDSIICDPQLAAEFDACGARIAPGYSPLQYRWAAFNLRKASRLKPELLARVAPPVAVAIHSVKDLDLGKIPAEQGLYIFFMATGALYVGEAENLFKRLKKHLDHSDNKGLARWMWEHGTDDVHVEIQVLAADMKTIVRRALETELIRSRTPLFNVAR